MLTVSQRPTVTLCKDVRGVFLFDVLLLFFFFFGYHDTDWGEIVSLSFVIQTESKSYFCMFFSFFALDKGQQF